MFTLYIQKHYNIILFQWQWGKARPGLKVSNPLPGCAAGRSAGLRSTKTSHLQCRGAWLRCSRRKSFEPGLTQGKALCVQRRGRKTFLDDANVRQPVPQQAGDEIEVFGPAGHEFGNGQVMDFQAESCAAAGVFVSHWHEAFAPAGGQNRCVRPDAVGVVTEGLMKGRAFADGAVDQIAVGRVAQGEKMVPRYFRWNGLGGERIGPPSPRPSPPGEGGRGGSCWMFRHPSIRPRLPVHRSPKGLTGWALSKSPEGGAGSLSPGGEGRGEGGLYYRDFSRSRSYST